MALVRLAVGALRPEAESFVCELEEGVAKRNLDFFHIPTVLVHGAVQQVADHPSGLGRSIDRPFYPAAFSTSDLVDTLPRLAAIEQALSRPGRSRIRALLALRKDAMVAQSSLMPPEGLPPLTAATVGPQPIPVEARRQMLDLGARLRATSLLRSLSVAEAAILSTFVERCNVEAGRTIIRQGEPGDDLFVIESGHAAVHVRGLEGQRLRVRALGPGDYFGEISLLTGGKRTADVTAVSPMTLLRLGKATVDRYLACVAEVQQELALTATARLSSLFAG